MPLRTFRTTLPSPPSDCVIIVMGPTGAGKSSFISVATRQDDRTVGHGLESYTPEVRPFRTAHPVNHGPVVFVDTPGFDDTFKSDMDILGKIAEWLVRTYKRGIPLAGIIYMHRISDNRMGGTSIKNLRMFSSICGLDAMPDVILVTSMWDVIRGETGEGRENELKQTFWRNLIDHGCKTERFDRTFETAWKIVDKFPRQYRGPLQLPKELVDTHLSLGETHAGVTLREELLGFLQQLEGNSRRLMEQSTKSRDALVIQHLSERRLEIDHNMRMITEQLRAMRMPPRTRLRSYLRRRPQPEK